jgi:hypothetical protein
MKKKAHEYLNKAADILMKEDFLEEEAVVLLARIQSTEPFYVAKGKMTDASKLIFNAMMRSSDFAEATRTALESYDKHISDAYLMKKIREHEYELLGVSNG